MNKTPRKNSHSTSNKTDQLAPWVAFGLVVLLFCASLLLGRQTISPASVVDALFGTGTDAEALRLILLEIRLPRALLGLTIGAMLGLSGAALQGWLRNPLAEPGLVGVSSGAALGAVIALYFGFTALIPFAVPLFGIIGGLGAVLIVYALAGAGSAPATLILAGIAVSAFAGALTNLALNLAPNPFAAMEIMFWLMGSLADRSMDHVKLAVPFMLAGFALLLPLSRALDALSLGDEVATSLGIDLKRIRVQLVFGAALGVGAATSVAGIIGFIGLVAPHLMRPFSGGRPGRLLPLAALAGACLLLGADLLVRFATPQQEMQLGVLTSMLGAPFFLMLILDLRKRNAQ